MKLELPPLPATDWLLHMPAKDYEPEWTSSQDGYTDDQMREYGEACARAAIEAAADLCETEIGMSALVIRELAVGSGGSGA